MTIKKIATAVIATALAIGTLTALPANADNDGDNSSSVIADLRSEIVTLNGKLADAATAKATADSTITSLQQYVIILQANLANSAADAVKDKATADATIASLQADKVKDAATISALQAELAKAKADAGTDKNKDAATIAALQAELAKTKVDLAAAVTAGGTVVNELKVKYNKLAKRFNSKVRKIHRVALLPLP
jgi:chromosome segregation ATPase